VALGVTSGGLGKVRALEPGSRIALVAPASPFDRTAFEDGCRELERIGLSPIFERTIFQEGPIVAGDAWARAEALRRAWQRDEVDAVLAVRGGYGSMEVLPWLTPNEFRRRPLAFIGYSDTTALHIWLNGHVGITSVHGAMIDGRLAKGESAYDVASFLASLSNEPVGELAPDGVETIVAGEATGTLVGGTLTQLVASLGTPYDFRPPRGAVIFIEEVNERPYRVRRMLEQLRQSGRLCGVAGLVFGQFTGCNEPSGRVTARSVIEEFTAPMHVPVMFGFPSGHTTTPLVSLPFGVRARAVASSRPRLVLDEAAAG
jgi:muramoyltetrapeptide carboxypeptidase